MYTLIGISSDGSERWIMDGFASVFEAWVYADMYAAANACDINVPAWYRFDEGPV
jgi:hypothetical protein